MSDPTVKLRLFFALKPQPEQNTALVSRVAPLAAGLDAQCVPAENIHATLCFLGAVAPEDLPRLKDVAAERRARRVELLFDSLEFWKKPQILCATAREGADAARDLAESLGKATLAAGFHPDPKLFRAHLTLARKVDPARAEHFERPMPLTPPMLVRCDRFVLMESRRGELGSTYSVVDSWPLYAHDTDSSSSNIQ